MWEFHRVRVLFADMRESSGVHNRDEATNVSSPLSRSVLAFRILKIPNVYLRRFFSRIRKTFEFWHQAYGKSVSVSGLERTCWHLPSRG